MSLKIIIGTILFALLGFLGYSIFLQKETTVLVTSFEECVQAGYPVQESFPERCVTPQGESFTNLNVNVEEQQQITPPEHELIHVTSPQAGSIVTSPLTISGEARGYWFFEASFPYTLADSNGNVLAQGPISASGEWMTEDFVPFSALISFSAPQTATGTLTLMKDNPSDNPELDDQIVIPVSFE